MASLRHVVIWKLKDPSLAESTIPQMKAKLESLVGVVPGLKALNVSPSAFPGEGNWDVVLISDHDSADDFRTYQTHPAHLEVASWVSEQVGERASLDYLLEL